jgi:lipoyl(octanoyl) transferase
MRGLPQQLTLGNLQAVRDRVEPDDFRLAKHSQAFRAVAVGPLHEMRLLAGKFHQVPQECLLIVGEIHVRSSWRGGAREVKAHLHTTPDDGRVAPSPEMRDMTRMTASASTLVQPAANRTIDWGRTRYETACRQQAELVAQRIAGEIGDTLVFTEHEPVFTIGLRAGAGANLVWDEARLSREKIDVVKTNRGGDITYHGPGQIVGYPIVSLAPRQDLHAYLRFLEQVLINALGSLGLAAARREGKTGIWLGPRKIAAIGVAVRRWVTYHGFALNVDPDLTHFAGIIPCGIGAADGTVTSLRAELGREQDLAEVKTVVAREFWELLPRFLAADRPGR